AISVTAPGKIFASIWRCISSATRSRRSGEKPRLSGDVSSSSARSGAASRARADNSRQKPARRRFIVVTPRDPDPTSALGALADDDSRTRAPTEPGARGSRSSIGPARTRFGTTLRPTRAREAGPVGVTSTTGPQAMAAIRVRDAVMAVFDCTRPRRRALAIIRHNFLSESTHLLRYSRSCHGRDWGGAMSATATRRDHSTARARAVGRGGGRSIARLASIAAVAAALVAIAAAGFHGVAEAQPAAPDEPLRITRITPAGQDVPAPRQIVIEFDRPMVPL